MFRSASSAIAMAATATMVAAAASGVSPWTGPLNQTNLLDDLNILEAPLEKILPETSYKHRQWAAGWIPQEVSDIVSNSSSTCGFDLDLEPADMTTWFVQYEDCGDPWVFSLHKDVNVTIDSMALQFGRVPVQMRQFVRYVIGVPGDPYAFNCDGSIVFVRPIDTMQNVFIHETGHSLDLQGAYHGFPAGRALSGSVEWQTNVDAQAFVPDIYSQKNYLEDLAQNTVVAVFNDNYKGGFSAVVGNWTDVCHGYETLSSHAARSGQGHSLFVPGESATCRHRLSYSAPIFIGGGSRVRRDLSKSPDTEIKTVPARKPFAHAGIGCDIMH